MDGWAAEVEEIARRRQAASAHGGPERVARQHGRGKLTARERVGLLVDEGSFDEIGVLAEPRRDRTEMENRSGPADGIVMGLGRIDGREVLVAAEDFTVMGGSVGYVGMLKRHRLIELAERLRVPVVWLFDGSGARSQEFLRAGWAGGPHFAAMARLSGVVPMVAAVMGPSAGDPALMAPLCDFVVMVRGTAMLAAGGPVLVQAATGATVTQDELGGADLHTRISGVADNAVDDDEAGLDLVRRYLSYFPSNAWERPPRVGTDDPVDRRDEALLTVVPREPRRVYDMWTVVRGVVDRGSELEVKPDFAPSLVTCLARVDGHAVGVVANQPMRGAGAIDAAAADKLVHFVQLCDAFHLPLVFVTDVPGFMVGPHSERAGTLRRGMRVAHAFAFATVPMVSVVVRKAFGMGAVAMCGHESGQVLTLVWPSGDFGAMPLQGGVQAGHGSDLQAGRRDEAQVLAGYASEGGAFDVAGAFNFDDLVDPRETRARVARWLGAAARSSGPPPGPRTRHGIMP